MVSHIKSKIGSVAGSVGEGAGELPPLEAPVWSIVPDGSAQQGALYEIDMRQWVKGRALIGWLLTGNPAGVTISNQGLVTILDTVAAQVLSMTCYVENPEGNDTSNLFEWELEIIHVPEPPVWDVVPPQSTDFNDLPAQLDMNDFVTSFLPITDWTTTEGSITGGGILVIPAGTLVQTLSIVVTAENDDGVSPSAAFDWDITQEAPIWDTVPDLDAQEGEEYQVDMNTWIISGDDLENWSLSGNPAGVTIDQTGEVTILASVGVATLIMDCTVENQGGQDTSNTFTWELTETPLQPPIWLEQPEDQTTSDNDLPGTYDVSDLVFSLTPITWSVDAPATIDTEGVISIDDVPAIYPLVVNALNEDGNTDSDSFDWTITEIEDSPVWDEVPDGYENINNLPNDVDMNNFILSGDNLTGWALSGNPAGVTISGTGIVTVADTVLASRFTMTCYVENIGGSDTSNAFTWLVADVPVITQQPVPLNITVPDGDTNEVIAIHSDPEASLHYRWEAFDEERGEEGAWTDIQNVMSNISRAQQPDVSINSTNQDDVTLSPIRTRATVSAYSNIEEFRVISDEALVTVINDIPIITQQPDDLTVEEGDPASFTVVAELDGPLFYEWEASSDDGTTWEHPSSVLSDVDLDSVLTATLLLPSTSLDDVTPGGPPTITAQPQAQSVYEGDPAHFGIAVESPTAVSYFWESNLGGPWIPIEDAYGSVLGVGTDNVTIEDSDLAYTSEIRCLASNPEGDTPSNEVGYTINEAGIPVDDIIFATNFAEDLGWTWEDLPTPPTGFFTARGDADRPISIIADPDDGLPSYFSDVVVAATDRGTGLELHLTDDGNTGYTEIFVRYNLKFKAGWSFFYGTSNGFNWKWWRLWQNAHLDLPQDLAARVESNKESVFNIGYTKRKIGITWHVSGNNPGNQGAGRYANTFDYNISGGIGPESPGTMDHMGSPAQGIPGIWTLERDESVYGDETDFFTQNDEEYHTMEIQCRLNSEEWDGEDPNNIDGVFNVWLDGIHQDHDKTAWRLDGARGESAGLPIPQGLATSARGSGLNFIKIFSTFRSIHKHWPTEVDSGYYMRDFVVSRSRIGHSYTPPNTVINNKGVGAKQDTFPLEILTMNDWPVTVGQNRHLPCAWYTDGDTTFFWEVDLESTPGETWQDPVLVLPDMKVEYEDHTHYSELQFDSMTLAHRGRYRCRIEDTNYGTHYSTIVTMDVTED